MPKKRGEKLVPLPLRPPRISHEVTLDYTQGFAVKGERVARFNYGAGF
jgi:hypothetical protein